MNQMQTILCWLALCCCILVITSGILFAEDYRSFACVILTGAGVCFVGCLITIMGICLDSPNSNTSTYIMRYDI